MTAKGRAEVVRLFKKDGSAELRSPQQLQFAVDYLNFFGYIAVALLRSLDIADIKLAVKAFQRVFGLKVDGVLGPKTLRAMEGPRCGCPDIIDTENKQHLQFIQAQENSVAQRDQWNKKGLTYAVSQYVSGTVPKEAQSKIFAAAFKAWDDVCGLNITEIKDQTAADIIITTGKGPQHQFDGQGGTLAWAYLPTGADQQLTMRFDLDETWVEHPRDRGVLIHNVACHEFGHSLGLSHSTKNGALMAPYYNPFVGVPQMDDDIPRIEKLYGKNPAAIKATRKAEKVRTVEIRLGQSLLVTCK
jgi:predicted Zn-dependent protease